MNSVKVISVRNVTEALNRLVVDIYYLRNGPTHPEGWRKISPRGMATLEHRGPVITEYYRPTERVLLNAERDANPFFHLMEALWILDGRNDVTWIDRYLSSLKKYSDDGITYHAAYGHRMRQHFIRHWNDDCTSQVDQLIEIIELLRKEPDTRRAVMSFWDPAADLNIESKDIPCNDLLMFKVRDGLLDLTVSCRSNDAVWGAYGTNAVQFSMIQEFVAGALSTESGSLRQLSDSFHVYDNNESMQRMLQAFSPGSMPGLWGNPYYRGQIRPWPLFDDKVTYEDWLRQLRAFTTESIPNSPVCAFFSHVAYPIKNAWAIYKETPHPYAIDRAIDHLSTFCRAEDWKRACIEWLRRRDR